MRDQHRIKLLQQQDEAAFKGFVQEFQDRVYNTVLGFVHHVEDSEDVSQQVFVAAYDGLPKFKGECSLATWVHRIAINEALGFIRKRNTYKRKSLWSKFFSPSDQEFETVEHLHPGVSLENQERAKVLEAAIRKLPENQMVAFRLRHYDDLNYEKIAEVMQVSLSAVESLLFRAKKNLRVSLASYYQHNMK